MKLKSLNLTNSTLHHARDVVSVNALRDASILLQLSFLLLYLGSNVNHIAKWYCELVCAHHEGSSRCTRKSPRNHTQKREEAQYAENEQKEEA